MLSRLIDVDSIHAVDRPSVFPITGGDERPANAALLDSLMITVRVRDSRSAQMRVTITFTSTCPLSKTSMIGRSLTLSLPLFFKLTVCLSADR